MSSLTAFTLFKRNFRTAMTALSLTPKMLLAAIEDRTHALRCASVMVEKVLDAGEVDRSLHLSILQVIIARITNTEIIRADLLAPMNFIGLYRTIAAKSNIIAPAVGVIGRHIGVYFITIELIRRSAGRDATINRHDEGGESNIVLVVGGVSRRDQPHAEVCFLCFVDGRCVAFVKRLVAFIGKCAMEKERCEESHSPSRPWR